MKRIISLIIIMCLIVSCVPALAEDSARLGKPYVNPDLMTSFTERPGPEENFYLYANFDRFVEVTTGGAQYLLTQAAHAYHILVTSVQEIAENTEFTDPDSEVVRLLYGMFMDKEKLKQDGLSPLMSRIERLRAVSSVDELTALMQEDGFLIRTPVFMSTSFQPATFNAELQILYVGKAVQLEKIMPENPTEEELLKGGITDFDTPRTMLLKMQYSEEEADRVLKEIERYDNETMAEFPDWLPDYEMTVSLEQIRENCPLLAGLLTAAGYVKEGAESQPVYMVEPESLTILLNWYKDENLDALKAMVALNLYRSAMPLLDQEAVRETLDSDIKMDEEQAAYRAIKNIAEIPVNQAYVTHFCPEETWKIATELFQETREAMRARIIANTWMKEETKQKALVKLDDLAMGQLVPPGGNFDCNPLLADLKQCDTMLDAAVISIRFYNRCMMRFTGNKIERGNPYTLGDAHLGVLSVGGQYVPELNLFSIGAPALSEAMCDYTSRATLLGSLGTHIGHELSHGYDFIGAQYDVTRKASLFTEEDNAVFKEKAMAVARLLSQIESGNGVVLQGDKLITEAMADLTGTTLMLDLAKKEENFDYDAFFRAWADAFFEYEYGYDASPDEAGVNPHPPYHVRINFTLAHFDEFYQTYPSITEGTPMYLAPEDRGLVW